MKVRIIRKGKLFWIERKILWWWVWAEKWYDHIGDPWPHMYESLEDAKFGLARLYKIEDDEIVVWEGEV